MIPLLHLAEDPGHTDHVFMGTFFKVADAKAFAQSISRDTLSWMSIEFGSPRFQSFHQHGETPSEIWLAGFGRGSLVILDYGF